MAVSGNTGHLYGIGMCNGESIVCKERICLFFCLLLSIHQKAIMSKKKGQVLILPSLKLELCLSINNIEKSLVLTSTIDQRVFAPKWIFLKNIHTTVNFKYIETYVYVSSQLCKVKTFLYGRNG